MAWWHGAAITAVSLVLAIGLLLAIWLLAHPIALLLAAIVLANALEPAVDLFERRLPEAAAVGLAYGLTILAIAGLGWVIVPALLAQAGDVLAAAPTLLTNARGQLERWVPALGTVGVERLAAPLGEVGGVLIEVPLTLTGFLVDMILVLVMSAYWSAASDNLRRYVLTLVPRSLRDETAEVAREVVATIGGYVRARVVVAAIVAAVTYGGLTLIGVEYSLVLALLAGVGELVPYLGPSAAAIPALLVALLASPWQALTVLIFYVVVQQLKTVLLVPIIVRQQADIPPLLVIFALAAGTSVGGVIGAIVAPPLAGALRIVILRALTPPLRRWAEASRLGAGRARRPGGQEGGASHP